MKTKIFAAALLFINFNLHAKIIYIEPVQNAKYVSIHNNVIIGFDETIESSNLNSLVKVIGSLSGIHSGEIILTGDKKKLIFKPHHPFVFNEKVDVKLNHIKTSITSNNSLSYTFQTQIDKPERDYKRRILDELGYSSNNIFMNPTDTVNLPAITVTVSNNPSPGYLFMSNFPFGPIPNTPYLIIANNNGSPYYYKQINSNAYDFKKQPNGYLTYFSGREQKFYALDSQYNLIDSFYSGNGYITDLHELQIIDNGHFLLMIYDPQKIDMSQIVIGGHPAATVDGLIIQEMDENKNVVFQWRSWDHFEITDARHENLTAAYVDYVHGNAIELDEDGNIMISSRHLSEITKISRRNGEILWRLGGVRNQFTFVNDSIRFSYQHDIRRISNGNITLYDNGNFHTPRFSRAVEYQLDEINKIATLVWQYRNSPDRYGFAMGSVQRLQNGNTLISWGSTNPTITEVTPTGNKALEMSLPDYIYTYRAFKFDMPLTLNITLAMQGFYITQTNTLNSKDTVTSYLRSINSPYSIIDSSKSVIDSLSLKGSFKFYNVPTGTYYIAIKHKNSIETWSKTGGESFVFGNVHNYNFTNSNLNAYGNNLILKGRKYCIYSGDVNQDGIIDLTDLGIVYNASNNLSIGNIVSDINGDKFVNTIDIAIVYNNSSNSIIKITPP